MSPLVIVLIVVLIIALFGVSPHWGYSRGWGWYPFGGVGAILLLLVVFLLLGVIPHAT